MHDLNINVYIWSYVLVLYNIQWYFFNLYKIRKVVLFIEKNSPIIDGLLWIFTAQHLPKVHILNMYLDKFYVPATVQNPSCPIIGQVN